MVNKKFNESKPSLKQCPEHESTVLRQNLNQDSSLVKQKSLQSTTNPSFSRLNYYFKKAFKALNFEDDKFNYTPADFFSTESTYASNSNVYNKPNAFNEDSPTLGIKDKDKSPSPVAKPSQKAGFSVLSLRQRENQRKK